MPIATNNGIKLSYKTAGKGDPPIVFVHGWSCDQTYFDPQFDHFAKSHGVAALDLRGHGESDHPDGPYSIEAFVDDVDAVAADLGYERPVVIGHSMGGLVALAAAARGSARAAIMVDPAPIVGGQPVKDFIEGAAKTCEADEDGAWRSAFVKGMFMPTDTVRRDEIIAAMPTVSAAIAAACLRAIGDFDGEEALRNCKVPLVSIGSRSPSNSQQAMAELCPSITVGQTVGSGHFNQLEVPDQVNAMIARFLAVNGL